MKKSLAIIMLFSLFLMSCTKTALDDSIMIRIHNQTGKKITEASIYSFSHDKQVQRQYGTVLPHTATLYQSHDEAWDFPLFKLTIEGFGVLELIDMRCPVGIDKLSPGNYSLVIEDDTYPRVRLLKD